MSDHADAMGRELIAMLARGPMEVSMSAVSALHIAGLLQLVKRHPEMTPASRDLIDAFVAGVRDYFAGNPAILWALDEGDNPASDVPIGITVQ